MDYKFALDEVVQPLYAAVPGIAFSLGNTEVAFHVHADGAVHVMSAEVERALAQCRSFRTLDEHVAQIVQRNPSLADKQPAVRGVLEHLSRLGVIVPARDLVKRLGREVARDAAPLRAVVVRDTGDRAGLDATLASALAHERATGSRRRWGVVGRAESGTREALARVRDDGLDVRFVDAVRAADAFGAGDSGALELALLLGAGARIAQADAGTRFEFRRAPGSRDVLSLPRPGGLPLDLAESVEEASACGEPAGGDAIAQAESWCGRTVGAVVAGGLALDAAGVAGYALGHPDIEPGTRIVAVDFAVRGAPRGADPAFPWHLRGEARERLWRSRELHDAQRRQPCLVMAPTDVRAVAGVSTVPFLLDGSALLPPTHGDGAGAERLFGILLRLLHPDALVLRAATTIARAAPAGDGTPAVHTPAVADLLAELAQGAQSLIKSDDPATRLARYAVLVRDLGEAPARRRLEVLSGFVAHRRAAHLTQLQNDLDGLVGAPGWWTDALTEAIVATGRPLTAHTTPRLSGWPETLDEAGCAERLGADLLEFAARCERWPQAWDRAKSAADEVLTGT
ncbi:MAG TPA: hypothetical protein VND91_05100 [Candidatus Saccharimonadia bacterium]|nr:hypothetical protein [Candidatus Saccharimonadia bacterium]